MKLFFSYGHDGNTPFVKRLADDLRARNHVIWFDEHDIAPNDDWRRRIVEGLRDTDWTLAFLSPHAVRKDSVCRDEWDITFGETGWALTPILVETLTGPDKATLPAHIQRLDMRDWRDHGPIGSETFEAWYAPHLQALLAVLDEPRNQTYGAEMRDLRARLAPPLPQHAEMARLTNGFVGRDWLLDKINAWRQGPQRAKLLWLAGHPGMGKSAFAAWLARMHHANIVALRLCSYSSDDRIDPARVLRALAFQLARRLADYRDHLRATLPASADALEKNPHELGRRLLVHPFAPGSAIGGGRAHDPFLLVVDGLDETVTENDSPLTALLTELAGDLPPWMALMVTSRPDSPVRDMLGEAEPLHFETHAAETDADIEIYTRAWLGGLTPPPAALDDVTAQVVAAAQGSMTYLRALQAMNHEAPALADLPRGLTALYDRWMARQCPGGTAELAALIDILAAASLPVPMAVLAEAAGLSAFEAGRRLNRLGSLFRRTPSGVVPFHLSLRDWLCQEGLHGPHRFQADLATGQVMLLAALWPRLLSSEAGEDAYLIGELPNLARNCGKPALRQAVMNADGWGPTHDALNRVAEALTGRVAWRSLVAWRGLHAHLAEAWGKEAERDGMIATMKRGDALITLGATDDAMVAYRDGIATNLHRAAADPSNLVSQRDLSVSHNKIGDTLEAQDDLPAALDAYRASMTIRERLAAADPSDPQAQRDVFVSHNKIGDVLEAQGDPAAALEEYRSGMAISARLAAAYPNDVEAQRDLSTSHQKIGDVLEAQDDLAAILEAYQTSMTIAARLAAADPSNAQAQRDLSISHDRIGDVLHAQRDLTAALVSYQASMTIAARLAAADPNNAQAQRDLSISHNAIGGVLRAQGDLAAALEAYQAGMTISARLAAADPNNLRAQGALAYSHNEIGRVLLAQGDLTGALDAYQACMMIRTRLFAADPSDAQAQRALMASHSRIANVLAAQGGDSGGAVIWRAELSVLDGMVERGVLLDADMTRYRKWLVEHVTKGV